LEQDIDLEGEEPDTMIKKKVREKRKQKSGLGMRGRIDKVAAELSEIASPSPNPNPNRGVQNSKRKAGPADIGLGAK
jgi:hypothetical protein